MAYWDTIPPGAAVAWVILALDTEDRIIDQSLLRRFHRAPDFDGIEEPDADWQASALKNLDFLLGLPDVDGDPLYLRSSAGRLFDPDWHHPVVYPALHHPSYINLFLEAAVADPKSRDVLHSLARRIARWLLDHTLPDAGPCARFPLTTWISGSFATQIRAHVEVDAITLFRAGRVGECMLDLYTTFGDPDYLAYAGHLARKFIELQRPDGSWPYRINPATGEVVEKYTAACICVAAFLDAVASHLPDNGCEIAARRALAWTLENPARTNRWQGMYEDIGPKEPFANLENWSAIEAIVYLSRHAAEDPGYLDTARRINRFVEDQFVVFGPQESHIAVQTVWPNVYEQYDFLWPMEVHSGNWLRALIALHRASGDRQYLHKAQRVANAITRLQFPDGRYSGFGVDWRFGCHGAADRADWYGCNAMAATDLLRWSWYHAQLSTGGARTKGAAL